MGFLDAITKPVKTALKNHAVKKQKNERKQIVEMKRIPALRKKVVPMIRKLADEYHAKIDILDKSVYVYKEVNGRERGVHIGYDMKYNQIKLALEKKFMKPDTLDKVVRGAQHTAAGIKTVRKAAGMVRKELDKVGTGGMYKDPNFGKSMMGSSGSGGGTLNYGGSSGESPEAARLRKMYKM